MKTPEEAMELIENMAASDHAILHDRAYTPTKMSLLELTAQDANKGMPYLQWSTQARAMHSRRRFF